MGLRLAGPLTDRFGNKPLIILGLIGAAAGPFFWLPTAPGGLQNYWIMYGAYVVWGAGWACVNLGSQNLMLKVAPRGNNVAYIAAAQGLGGVCVAICTVVGGNWLEHLQDTGFTFSLGSAQFNAYHLFFLLSFVGRSSAALWVFGIREPGASSIRQMIMTLRQRSTA
jgi:MFS family permease